jgi:hypothetical protein
MSKYFPKTHPAAGEETRFVESILNGTKTTTIRGKYENWKNKASEVNEGKAILSIRYWTGSPYNYKNDNSKQKEFARCTKLSTDRVFVTNDHNGFEMSVESKYCDRLRESEIIKNEGFKKDSHFYDWFPQEEFSGIMLGFLEIEKVS